MKKNNKKINLLKLQLAVVFVAVSLLFFGVITEAAAPTAVKLSTITSGLTVPIRVAVDSQNNIYVSDPARRSVQKFNAKGELKLTFTGVAEPLGIAVDENGIVYIGDGSKKNVTVFNQVGTVIQKLGSGDGELELPGDIAIDPSSGKIFVSDSKANLVRIYNSDGSALSTISGFKFPAGIHIDSGNSELLVSDQKNYLVKVYNLSGGFKRSFGSHGGGNGQFMFLQGLTVDGDGRIYVADSYKGWIQVFDSTGNHLSNIANNDLNLPLDLAFDSFGRLVIASSNSGLLVLYGIDGGDIPANWGNDDVDGDGMPDDWETANGLDTGVDDSQLDPDGDGLTNYGEYLAGTDPHKSDTDNDGIPDNVDPNPTLATANQPTANAGPDATYGPSLVSLDGTGSSDPNSFDLTYNWLRTGGTGGTVTLSENNTTTASQPSFVATGAGTYSFSLTVKNKYNLESATDNVVITINNVSPTADAGLDQTVDTGTRVALDGTGSSDANGDSISYSWTQVSGDSITLKNGDTVSPYFTPSVSGAYILRLVVNDGSNSSSPDDITVTANSNVNTVPVANAGNDQFVSQGALVSLDGSKSIDGDGDALTYTWVQTSGTSITLSDTKIVNPTFTVSSSGVYTFALTVSDGTNTSISDEVSIRLNDMPVAKAGSDQEAVIYSTVTLGGGQSYDPDNSPYPLTYKWTQVYGITSHLDDSTSMTPKFVPIYQGIFRFNLVVSDGVYSSLADEVEIVIVGDNTPPVANAGSDQTTELNRTITLNGSGSDVDGDSLTYQWTQVQGASVTLSDAFTDKPTFLPPQRGIYEFELIVKDNKTQHYDNVLISVSLPNAYPGNNQLVKLESDGSGGYSAAATFSGEGDGDAASMSYSWEFTLEKSTSTGADTIVLSNKNSKTPSFTTTEKGNYFFTLVVSDKYGASAPQEIQVSVVEAAAVVKDIYTYAEDDTDKENKIWINSLIVPNFSESFSWIELFIPENAIGPDSPINYLGISFAEEPNPPALSDQNMQDESISVLLGPAVDFSPDGATFDGNGIQIKIPYTQEQLDNVGVTDPEDLRVYTYDLDSQKWIEVIGNRVVYKDEQYVEVFITHFSMYALGESDASDESNNSDDSDDSDSSGSGSDSSGSGGGGSSPSNVSTGSSESSGGGGGGGSGGCFIATAAYGSYFHPYVKTLRDFRDQVLLESGPGKLFVELYYRYSPPVADVIADHYSLKLFVRALLVPLILIAIFLVNTVLIEKILIVSMLVAIILLFKRNAKTRKCKVE